MLTFCDFAFFCFFINLHDAIFDGHKAQLLEDLDHFDQEDLLDLEIGR